MIPDGRKNEILAVLKQHGYCSVEELAECVYVSLPTMRRHLAEMEKEGLLKRVHGGASYLSFEIAINRVNTTPTLAKLLIHKSGPIEGDTDYLERLADVYMRGLSEVGAFIRLSLESERA